MQYAPQVSGVVGHAIRLRPSAPDACDSASPSVSLDSRSSPFFLFVFTSAISLGWISPFPDEMPGLSSHIA